MMVLVEQIMLEEVFSYLVIDCILNKFSYLYKMTNWSIIFNKILVRLLVMREYELMLPES